MVMTKKEFREWRRELDLTQLEAAARLGIARRTVQDYEGGKSAVPRYIELACEALKARANAVET